MKSHKYENVPTCLLNDPKSNLCFLHKKISAHHAVDYVLRQLPLGIFPGNLKIILYYIREESLQYVLVLFL